MRPALVLGAIALSCGSPAAASELGLASFYGAADGLTAAHRSLPMGSQVRVVNLDNGRSAILRIVDRGPFIRGRIIDVSTEAAVTLGFREAGLAHVQIERLFGESPQGGGRGPRLAVVATSSYAVCLYGADRLAHLRSDPPAEAAKPAGDPLGCDHVHVRPVRLDGDDDPLAPAVAALTAVPPTGLEAAASIPVTSVADMAAAESIPVGDLTEAPNRQAAVARRPASTALSSLFADLRRAPD